MLDCEEPGGGGCEVQKCEKKGEGWAKKQAKKMQPNPHFSLQTPPPISIIGFLPLSTYSTLMHSSLSHPTLRGKKKNSAMGFFYLEVVFAFPSQAPTPPPSPPTQAPTPYPPPPQLTNSPTPGFSSSSTHASWKPGCSGNSGFEKCGVIRGGMVR